MPTGGTVHLHFHEAPKPKASEPKQAGLGQSQPRAKGGIANQADMSPEDTVMEGHRQRFIQGYVRGKNLARKHRQMGINPTHIAGLAELHRSLGGLVDGPGRFADGGAPGLDPVDMVALTRAAQRGAKQAGFAADVPGFEQPQSPPVSGQGYATGGGLTDAKMNVLERGAFSDAAHTKTAAKSSPGIHLISSNTPGRNDRIPMRSRHGSFILPADVVSGLGQGNTNAGAKMWGQTISHAAGPYLTSAKAIKPHASRPSGSPNPQARARAIAPMTNAPRLPKPARGFQDGGESEYTPIITAGGELVIDPEYVEALGDGDPEVGRKMLSDSVISVRKQVIDSMKKLPGPVE